MKFLFFFLCLVSPAVAFGQAGHNFTQPAPEPIDKPAAEPTKNDGVRTWQRPIFSDSSEQPPRVNYAQQPVDWRMVYHQGMWWYWFAPNKWAYYDKGNWIHLSIPEPPVDPQAKGGSQANGEGSSDTLNDSGYPRRAHEPRAAPIQSFRTLPHHSYPTSPPPQALQPPNSWGSSPTYQWYSTPTWSWNGSYYPSPVWPQRYYRYGFPRRYYYWPW